MANSLLTDKVIAREALMQFKNALGFTKGANRQYDARFAKSGAKIGNSIDIRVPQRFVVNDGANITSTIQDVTHQTRQLKLDQRKHVAFKFDTEELTLSIDKFSETYITPAARALANKVDVTGLALGRTAFNMVGTPGTALTNSDFAGDAGQKLTEFACPMENRNIILNPKAMKGVVKGDKELFNPQAAIGEAYKKGYMSEALGFKWMESNNIAVHTVGPLGGAPLVKGAAQTGDEIDLDGFTAAAAARLKAGDVLTFDGVYAVNPVTYESTGELQQFVVKEDVSSDGSGNATVKISPEIITTGNLKNVTNAPADNAPVLVFGHASSQANKVSPINLAYHKDAAILGCADLYIPNNVEMASVASDPESGLSVRFIRFYDGKLDEVISRLDILYGWLLAHPEWMVRVQS